MCEVLIDNDTWEPLQTELADLGWPSRKEFYSARLFLVANVLEGGIVSTEAAVQKLAEIIASSPQVVEDEIYAAMSAAGIPTHWQTGPISSLRRPGRALF